MTIGSNYKTFSVIAILLLISVLIIIQVRLDQNKPTTSVLGAKNGASVLKYERISNLTVKLPLKKDLQSINRSLSADIVLVNCQDQGKTYSFKNLAVNSNGYATVTISPAVFTLDVPYKIYVRSDSSLTQVYGCYTLSASDTMIDLTLKGNELITGETSIVFDNYINTLDLSVMIKDMYTQNNNTDLNKDGIVNSLDLSSQIHNLFIAGN